MLFYWCKQLLPILPVQQTVRTAVAESRMEIDQSRLLVLKAAHAIDCNGTKGARKEVSNSCVYTVRLVCVLYMYIVVLWSCVL